MNYDNQSVRRQDRLLEEDRAIALLTHGDHGVLSLEAEEGGGYGIPVNFVWDGDSSVYLHCAPQGRKLRCIARQPKASFCVIGRADVVPNKFTTLYESVILSCEAHINLPPEERMKALELLIDKYSPEHKIIGAKYTEKSFHRTEIIRLDISQWSGKSKKNAVINVTLTSVE